MPEAKDLLYTPTRAAWREWLENHHESANEIWLTFYKKHTGKPCISYDDAVEEALCFGWIDGIKKRVDEERYTHRFSPRKRKSVWSEWNKKRVDKLMKQGLMTEAGMILVREAQKNGTWEEVIVREQGDKIPKEFQNALNANKKALDHFHKMAPGYKKQYILWILDAKRTETRERRILEAITLLNENKKLGMK